MHVISGSCHSEQKRFSPRHVASDVIDRTLWFFIELLQELFGNY